MIQLAVNGTLMRGLGLNKNLINAGAKFIREAKTRNGYRLYSISEVHPAMYREINGGGSEISVEIWELDGEGLVSVLVNEPPGLCIGKVELNDGTTAFGVLGEQYIFKDQKEITHFGGWREYVGNTKPTTRMDTGPT